MVLFYKYSIKPPGFPDLHLPLAPGPANRYNKSRTMTNRPPPGQGGAAYGRLSGIPPPRAAQALAQDVHHLSGAGAAGAAVRRMGAVAPALPYPAQPQRAPGHPAGAGPAQRR